MKAKQLRELIIRPTLKDLDSQNLVFYSMVAEDLLLATACAESHCGHYIKQETNDGYGVAEGIYQMEPTTQADIENNWIAYRPIFNIYHEKQDGDLYNMKYATVMARLHYFRQPAALPEANPNPKTYLLSLARYWKKYYNTEKGAGTVAGFVEKCEKYGDFL